MKNPTGNRSTANQVAIPAVVCRKSRMKCLCDRGYSDHPYAPGKQTIDSEYPRLVFPGFSTIKVDNLAGRMHAGICPAGTDYRDGLVRDLRQRSLEGSLNGIQYRRFLPLPSGKSRPVILDGQRNPVGGN